MTLCGYSPANAIIINGIYTGSCERKIGVILEVDSYSIHFLNIDGKFEILPRHQVVQMVSYSLDQAPFSPGQKITLKQDQVTAYKITTLNGVDERPLVSGFPIEFTDSKIAFLTQKGSEVLIDKQSIAKIEKFENFDITSEKIRNQKLNFSHSYTFINCEKQESSKKDQLIYPEQVLTESLTIKRELDRLQKGFELVRRYEDEQDFYSKPYIYNSRTSLGLWHSFGSRYGYSSSRTNNFTPVLTSELASDIYDFQRLLVTGSAPNSIFEHAEAQTQVFYSFKASYFHFAAYFDPSLFLVGTNFPWKLDDVGTGDAKISSTGGMGFGFDRGPWQIGFISSSLGLGINPGDLFFEDSVPMGKLHLTYGDLIQKFELLTGQGSRDVFGTERAKVKINHLRLNYSRSYSSRLSFMLSYISNDYSLNPINSLPLDVKTRDYSGLLNYSISRRMVLQGLGGVEVVSSSVNKLYPKAGSSIHIFF